MLIWNSYLFTASTEPSMGTPAPLSKRTPLMSNKTPLIFLLLFHEAIVLSALLPSCLYFNVSICMQLLGCCSWSVLCFAQTGALGKKYNENYLKKEFYKSLPQCEKNDLLFAIKRIYLQCVFAVTVTALIHLQPVLRFSGTWYRSCFDSYKFNVFILETFVLNKNNIWQERTILTLKR